MATHFCVSVRFLLSTFHGRGDGEVAEWPPSPLRIFQALVASAASGRGEWRCDYVSAFERLESLGPPILVAADAVVGDGYRLSVPNNSMDKVAAAWAKGKYFGKGDASPAGHKAMKRIRPHLLPEDGAIHCVWRMPNALLLDALSVTMLNAAARRITSLGWGVDMAIGDARIIDDEAFESLGGTRWLPVGLDASRGLRVPMPGTFAALCERYAQFLSRLRDDSLCPPVPLTRFRVVEYCRAKDPAASEMVCFALADPEEGMRAFDPRRSTIRVAGMLRGATKRVAESDPIAAPDVAGFVLGHGEQKGEKQHRPVDGGRFAYLPLPSIESRGAGRIPVVGAIRRVGVAVFECGHRHALDWARRMLSGTELIREASGEPVAMLVPAAGSDGAVRRYLQLASEWATVSPVVLPGYDDPRHYRRRLISGNVGADEQRRLLSALHKRVDRLLRKAILEAGFSGELAAQADLDWRESGFWGGTDRASDYTVAAHLMRFPRLHVQVKWRDANGDPVQIAGPLCLGRGRYYGIGLFAALR